MVDLYKVISGVFKIEVSDISDNLTPADIEEWDSLGQLKLVVALENHYKIKFEIEEMFEISAIADIRRLLAKKGIRQD